VYTTRTHKRRRGEQVSFRLVTLKDEGKLFVFATNTNLKPRKIRKLFRKRWGIETSFRIIRKFHAKTTSKLYRLRTLYFYMAVMLYNLWVLLNYKHETGIPVYTLKLHITLSLVLSFLPDLEADHTQDKQPG
jgi:IS4 transposase